MNRVIMFAFWGRQENVELQLPYIQRILDENPNVEFHGWDLCRDRHDSRFLRTIKTDRIQVRTDFYNPNGRASAGQIRVWNHYTDPSFNDAVFVKLDDDDVYLETDGFQTFVQAAVDNPGHVISALTINNGASTRHIPELWTGLQSLLSANEHEASQGKPLELLDVHLSAEFAQMCHRWFHANGSDLLNGEGLIPTDDWVSINAIAMTWPVLSTISGLIGRTSPEEIAGRFFTHRSRIGDEGAANILPRLICRDFVVGHLNFGPQIQRMDNQSLAELRELYADINARYLATAEDLVAS